MPSIACGKYRWTEVTPLTQSTTITCECVSDTVPPFGDWQPGERVKSGESSTCSGLGGTWILYYWDRGRMHILYFGEMQELKGLRNSGLKKERRPVFVLSPFFNFPIPKQGTSVCTSLKVQCTCD
jgi:hypothetical protein